MISVTGAIPASCPFRVKLRRTQCEHMFSALLSNADIHRGDHDVSEGPIPDLPSWAFPLEMIPARPRLWGSRSSTPVRWQFHLSEPTVGHGTGTGGSD